MRKLIYVACSFVFAAVLFSCADKGPALAGKWVSEGKAFGNDSTANMVFTMNLNEDSTLALNVDAVMDSEEQGAKIHMPFNFGFKGTWSLNEDKLTWHPVDSTSYAKLLTDSMKIEFDKPEMQMFGDKIMKSMTENFEKEIGKEMLGKVAKEETMKYLLNGDDLTLYIDTDTLVLHRAK